MEENIKQNIRIDCPNSFGICVVNHEYWARGVCRGGQRGVEYKWEVFPMVGKKTERKVDDERTG